MFNITVVTHSDIRLNSADYVLDLFYHLREFIHPGIWAPGHHLPIYDLNIYSIYSRLQCDKLRQMHLGSCTQIHTHTRLKQRYLQLYVITNYRTI